MESQRNLRAELVRASPCCWLAALVFIGCHPDDTVVTTNDPNTGRRTTYEAVTRPDGTTVTHGVKRVWYGDGEKYFKGRFEMGVPVGEHVHWHTNGAVWSRVHYVDGQLDGHDVTYYDSGNLMSFRRWKMGVQMGIQLDWYGNGVLALETFIDANEPHGPFRRWNEAGFLVTEGGFWRGHKHGEWRMRNFNNGGAEVRELWSHGKLLSTATQPAASGRTPTLGHSRDSHLFLEGTIGGEARFR